MTAADKAARTREALVVAARERFGEQGYAATSVDEIVRDAGVTKGALYHHFADKEALFRAVVEDVKGNVTSVMAEKFLDATAEPDALDTVIKGCLAFIDVHRDRAVRRITLLDARSVLDAATRRELEARYEVAVIRGALRRAANLGVIDPQPFGPLAHVLAGGLSEACALLAEVEDEAAVRDEIDAVVSRLLAGLRPQPTA